MLAIFARMRREAVRPIVAKMAKYVHHTHVVIVSEAASPSYRIRIYME